MEALKTILIWGREERFGAYRRAVEDAGGRAVFGTSPQDAPQAQALLLPGGGDMEPWRYGQENWACRDLEPDRDQAELDLLARFTAAGKPVLGICRGLQTINVFFGGGLLQDVPGHAALNGQDRIHPVRFTPARLPSHSPAGGLAAVLRSLTAVNSAHHQAVSRTGAGLIVLQRSPDGLPEALAHLSLPVWGLQWHPERFGEPGAGLFRAFLALPDP